jgi:hypothetical protein
VKILRNLVILIFLLVAVAVGVVMVMGESLVAEGIEQTGPAITRTSVKVGNVSIGPIRGRAGIDNVTIGNPAGFKEPFALSMGKISTELDVRSLFTDLIVIHEVELVNSEIIFENAAAGQNLAIINENVQSYVGPTTEDAATPTKFVIEDFKLIGARIKITGLGVESLNQEITLPDLHLTGIGQKDNGVSAADAAKQIFEKVMAMVQKELVKAQVEGILSDTIKIPGGMNEGDVTDKIRSMFKR